MASSSDPKPLKVLIAGAGIGGPCLAYWLSRAKLNPPPQITILERAPVPRTTGQAIDVRGPAVRVIKEMGLEPKIKEKRTPELGMAIVNESGATIARFDATGDETGQRQSMTSEYEILRADLVKIFVDALKDLPNVKQIHGQRVVELTQDDSGVDVKYSEGGGEERFDLVVAADGSMSKTRQLIFGPDNPKENHRRLGGYFAFFSIPYVAGLDEPPLCRVYNTHGRRNLMTRPHQDPETSGAYLSVVTSAKDLVDQEMDDALADGVPAQKKLLRKRMEDAGWQAKRLCDGMDQADDFYVTSLVVINMPVWHKGRCALLGDAGYSTAVSGVGTSLAIQGAYIMAGELARAIGEGKSMREGLEEYERVMRPMVEAAQTMSPGVLRTFSPETTFGVWLLRGFWRVAYWIGLFTIVEWAMSKRTAWEIPEYEWEQEGRGQSSA